MITLEDVKTYLEITDTDSDAYLTQQITMAEKMVETYCGREFDYVVGQTQIVFGPTQTLFLTRFPLEDITTVTDKNSNPFSVNDFVTDNLSGRVIYASNGCPWSNTDFVTVTYTGGYVECPADLQAVLLDMVATRYYQRGEDITRPLKSEKVDGIGSQTYATSAAVLSGQNGFGNWGVEQYAGVLDLYRIEGVLTR